jgi:putative transposase
MEEAIGTSGACRVFGESRATLHRRRNPKPRPEGPRPRPAPHPAELSVEERANILAVLDSREFTDKSPGQAYTILLDRGVYLCSEATMYRLLRERGQSGDRRAQATHPAKKKPELMADGPNQVWSWDITKLRGPARGVWFLLYVIIDILDHSRSKQSDITGDTHLRLRSDINWRPPPVAARFRSTPSKQEK